MLGLCLMGKYTLEDVKSLLCLQMTIIYKKAELALLIRHSRILFDDHGDSFARTMKMYIMVLRLEA